MAYTVKIRTLPGSPMLCEYECPVHGKFEQLVQRDAHGDPPSRTACGEYKVTSPRTGVVCLADAELAISAPSIKFWSRDPVPIGYASKSDEKDPRALDTEPLATGKMDKSEWSKWQRGKRQERRYQRKLKAGKISKRIQVGGG